MTTDADADAAFAVALSLLPGCGQHRLRALLATGSARQAWYAIRDGAAANHDLGPPSLQAKWRAAAAHIDPHDAWQAVVDQHAGAWVLGQPDYPETLADDPDPPPILYWQGDRTALARPSVAIVGTRRCTSYGSDVARQLGRDLATAGVAIVSGLALGIDGAAHEGALAARPQPPTPPIAVVGSGLDVVYPARHRQLWQRVRDNGLLLSEAPLGSPPDAWRFPLRNRIIAALAQVVVVVESHAAGGSMSTVRWAIERGVPVMAVPGSVRSPSSAGTNHLLSEGVAPVTDVQDVLVALSLEGAAVPPPPPDRAAEPHPTNARSPTEAAVLAAVDWTPTATEDVLRCTGFSLGRATAVLARLEQQGAIRRRAGWWERVGQPQ
ncbi:MAG: processing protein [Actinomycetota bacterium]|jgi:DNA processing protein|nr:processing protein [Actinomycetota bacterium]